MWTLEEAAKIELPMVGMKLTEPCGSDSYGCTIQKVLKSKSGRILGFVYTWDKTKRIDNEDAFSEIQEYSYEPTPLKVPEAQANYSDEQIAKMQSYGNGTVAKPRLYKNKQTGKMVQSGWRTPGAARYAHRLHLGVARSYRDPCF